MHQQSKARHHQFLFSTVFGKHNLNNTRKTAISLALSRLHSQSHNNGFFRLGRERGIIRTVGFACVLSTSKLYLLLYILYSSLRKEILADQNTEDSPRIGICILRSHHYCGRSATKISYNDEAGDLSSPSLSCAVCVSAGVSIIAQRHRDMEAAVEWQNFEDSVNRIDFSLGPDESN